MQIADANPPDDRRRLPKPLPSPPQPWPPADDRQQIRPGRREPVPFSQADDQSGERDRNRNAQGQIPLGPPRSEPQFPPQTGPATLAGLHQRLVVTRGQEQQVAALMPVEQPIGGAKLSSSEDFIDQAGHAQRQNRIHVVPQFPLREHPIEPAAAASQAVLKPIEKRIEVVVFDDEDSLLRVRLVVAHQVAGDLQPHRRLARAFFAEHDRGGRVRGIAIDFIPRGVINAGDAVFFEHRIGLRILFGERIAADAVMFEKLLYFHGVSLQERFATPKSLISD